MKKLLLGFACASAGAAFAVETTVATIDVIAVDSDLTNTVIAIPGLDLSSGGDLAISNLVKTTNLTAGDRLLAFADSQYECWTLNSGKKWEKAEKKFLITGSGADEVLTTDASMFTMATGSGIWISRHNTSEPIYIYAQHVSAPTSTVAAATTALVGNPKTASATPTVTGCSIGDKILVPTKGLPAEYEYRTENDKTGWYYRKGFSYVLGLPKIKAGTGFWYVSTASAVKISWGE